MNFSVSPLLVFKRLLAFIVLLLCANVIAVLLKFSTSNIFVNGIVSFFDFNNEANIPSLYSTLALLCCALLLFYIYWISRKKKVMHAQWLGLSLIFLFLAFDEISSFHEKLVPILRTSYDFGGYLYYAWVIPYGIAVVVLGLICIPFLIKLPKKIRSLFIVSGVVFVAGAAGMELLGGQHDELYGKNNYQYALYYTFEELLEMLGIAIFIYSLLTYIADFMQVDEIKIKLESSSMSEKDHKNKILSDKIKTSDI